MIFHVFEMKINSWIFSIITTQRFSKYVQGARNHGCSGCIENRLLRNYDKIRKIKLSFEKSEIHETNCKHCNEMYYGQSRIAIKTHYGEHLVRIKYGSEKSDVVRNASNAGQFVRVS